MGTLSSSDSDIVYPVIPLRDIVVFPGRVVQLFVGRQKSINALEYVARDDKSVLLVTQKEATQDDPLKDDLYRVGVIARVMQLLKLPDGTVKVLVEGTERASIKNFIDNEKFFLVQAEVLPDKAGEPQEVEALSRAIIRHFEQYIKLNKKILPEAVGEVSQIQDPGKLADAVISYLGLKISEKQELLETLELSKRLERVYSLMESEINVMNTERKIRSRVKKQMEKTQREYYLNEQLKAIQKELGENEDGGKDEVSELERQIKKKRLTKEAREKALTEVKKLRMMSPMSAEATVVRNYLDWIISLPWKQPKKIRHDVKHAEVILNEDHFGLEKVKERILEYLAVQQRTKQMKGPILCLVGPPGVGKTSLAQSIARATGRSYARMSLGGVRDEAEIRGHRRTYIGSMPGKILQGMKKAKSSNPLFLLDELDKMSYDFRGDPASALLEVLDPEQNSKFNDHYLEVDYDLSEVLFIATANTMNMPRPLIDRMEVIHISGYTEEEKEQIARRHLIPKQLSNHGLKDSELIISDDALKSVIRYYTRESGVRNLEREIAKISRKAVKEIIVKNLESVRVTAKNLKKYLGVQKYDFGEAEKDSRIGVTTGLAYTEVGGDLLYIEAVTLPGKGKITITGKLGDVMQESVQAAFSYVRSRAQEFGISQNTYHNKDIHVHVPEGATPKDGPSAGAAITTSIISVMTGIPVNKDIAMTGEISLRGTVLPIGGLKEKLLAALRGGIKTVLIPQKNVKDLEEIPQNVKRGLEIIPVSHVNDVLKITLMAPLTPIEWKEAILPPASQAIEEEVTTH